MIAPTERLASGSVDPVREIKKDDEPRVSAKWVEMYNEALDAFLAQGGTQKGVAQATNAKEAQVSRLRQGVWNRSVNEIADFLKLPRPYVLVSSPSEAAWIDVGRRIREADHDRFSRLLARLSQQADLLEKIQEEDQAIAEMAPDPVSEGDDTT